MSNFATDLLGKKVQVFTLATARGEAVWGNEGHGVVRAIALVDADGLALTLQVVDGDFFFATRTGSGSRHPPVAGDLITIDASAGGERRWRISIVEDAPLPAEPSPDPRLMCGGVMRVLSNPMVRVEHDLAGNIVRIKVYSSGKWMPITVGSGGDPMSLPPLIQRADIPDLIAALEALKPAAP